MIDTKALRKKWNTEKPKTPARKKTVKKTGKKIVKKSDPKPTTAKTVKKETVPPSAVVPAKRRPPVNKDYDNPADAKSSLLEQAEEAQLREKISKAKLAEYKVEKEKLELEKRAGDVMETSFGEYLYFGYMEKVNLDLLRMMKRVEPMIDNMVNDRNTAGIIKRINNEITGILKGIQKQQDEDSKGWKKEL